MRYQLPAIGSALTGLLLAAVALSLCLHAGPTRAQGMYKYRDEYGQWVYTDRKPDASVTVETLDIGPGQPMKPDITVQQVRTSDGAVLRASNGCTCPVEFAVRITAARGVTVPGTGSFTQTVPAQTTQDLILMPADDGASDPQVAYDWGYVIGEPNVPHRPERAYRVPFAVAGRFPVSQAFPSTFTHRDPSSRYAVDIAMPEGTAIYAARGGVVIDVAYGNFKSGIGLEYADKANYVRILHDDGTYAIYAHLRWDSIRVRPGQQVQRGEFIAASGNTGFSSGPHLHFAVQRNVGFQIESVPVMFEGAGGSPVMPAEGQMLTAY